MKLLQHVLRLPIQRKLTLLVLMPCLVVLLLAGAALFGFEVRIFRQNFARDINAVAEIVGANSTAAIAFNDPKAATEILRSLEAKDAIVSAILILPDGTMFAQYGQHIGEPVMDSIERFVFREQDALMIEPVMLDGKQVATLNVVSNYHDVYASLLKLVGWMLLVVVLVGSGVALALSNWLQRFISDPVLRLTHTAQTVADRKNYSVRAREESGVEMGILTRTFNQMLARIQEQDEAINLSQQKLDAIIHSIPGVLWELDASTLRMLFVSNQGEVMLGYPTNSWLEKPNFWESRLHPEDRIAAKEAFKQGLANGKPFQLDYRVVRADGRTVWIRDSVFVAMEGDKAVRARGVAIDITEQKAAAEELDRLHRRLIESSRLAGMTEVATGVLHNVGNVLNSVGVSVTLVSERLKQSKLANLRRAIAMLRDQNGQLTDFLTRDPKGRVLPEYLSNAAEQLAIEQGDLLGEMAALSQNIEHIKEIVAMQQSYAKVSGAFEHLDATELVEDALRMNAAAFERHRIEAIREFCTPLPRVNVDRHKVLQILINVLRNAKYALDNGNPDHKRLVVRVEATPEGRLAIRVRDNGIGIPAENLSRIFGHGFTTKRDGHGFGLHSGANAAREMGGRLFGESEGLGKGACFTLELPASPAKSVTEITTRAAHGELQTATFLRSQSISTSHPSPQEKELVA